MQQRSISKGGRPAGSTTFDPIPARAFGNAVRELRMAKGLAQEALALRAEVDRGFMGHVERGERQPSLSVILKIAKAIGCSPAELMQQTAKQLPVEYVAPEVL
ncbi:MAG: XRE family transcriptional regulator [Aquabacterium sp.]|uniref:helix-turn-helix domain-containing protein n=1 Tax=Aquabacterium sp. TaxID=1872578 RepID=UPI001200D984|nr:helix-turn-helix transcriptional regulator [Aquabacterium sp.]TAK98982.1 MAG: XRE family transcriptional regulator [Aquabacterium sp.]